MLSPITEWIEKKLSLEFQVDGGGVPGGWRGGFQVDGGGGVPGGWRGGGVPGGWRGGGSRWMGGGGFQVDGGGGF